LLAICFRFFGILHKQKSKTQKVFSFFLAGILVSKEALFLVERPQKVATQNANVGGKKRKIPSDLLTSRVHKSIIAICFGHKARWDYPPPAEKQDDIRLTDQAQNCNQRLDRGRYFLELYTCGRLADSQVFPPAKNLITEIYAA